MLYKQLRPKLINVSNTCEDAPLLRQVNTALEQLNDAGCWVGSIVRAKVKTFDGNFTLPREMRRPISVQQCDGQLENAGYYQIDSQALYISPEFIQDAPITDLGEGPLERALFTPTKIYASCDFEADAGAVVQIQGLYADIPVISLNQANEVMAFEEFTLTTTPTASQRTYAQITSFTKPVTKGPVRLIAETAAGQKYLVLVAWPEETYPVRRKARFSDLYQPCATVLRAAMSQNTITLDLADTPPVCVGSEVLLTGFSPAGINGMHIVSGILENTVYFQSPLIPFTEDTIVSCIGNFLTTKTLLLIGTRQFVDLVDDNSIVPFTNVPAIRSAVRAVAKFEGDDKDSYDKYMADAVAMLKQEAQTYGLDPTNQAARTEQYRFAISNYPPKSIGCVASRIAQDLRKSIKVAYTDMVRIVSEAEERLLTSGLYMDAVIPRRYATDGSGRIQLEDDCYSMLAAKLKLGPRIQLESRYYDYQKDPWYAVAGSSSQFGAWSGAWTFAGAGTGCSAVDQRFPIQADFAARLIDEGKGQWRLDPQLPGIAIDAMVRLRSVRYECSTQEMVFNNFAALKSMTEAILAADLKDSKTEEAKHARAIDLADKDLGASRGGAQLRGRMSRWTHNPQRNIR